MPRRTYAHKMRHYEIIIEPVAGRPMMRCVVVAYWSTSDFPNGRTVRDIIEGATADEMMPYLEKRIGADGEAPVKIVAGDEERKTPARSWKKAFARSFETAVANRAPLAARRRTT